MKRRLAGFLLIAGLVCAAGLSLVRAAETPQQFSVKTRSCFYTFHNDGTVFTVSLDIRNIGEPIQSPLTIWVLYDNKICAGKFLNQTCATNELLFGDKADGRWFRCQVDVPKTPQEAKQHKNFVKVVYTPQRYSSNWDSPVLFWGSTDQCGVGQ